jgi:hypothetical protein
MGNTPTSILYSSDGYEISISNASTTTASNRALLIAGSDGSNNRLIALDTTGRQLVVGAGTAGTPAGGVITIQGSPSGTPVPVSVPGLASLTSMFGSATPPAGSASGFSDGTNMQMGRVFDVDSGAGTQYVLGVNLRQSSSGGSVELGTGSNPLTINSTFASNVGSNLPTQAVLLGGSDSVNIQALRTSASAPGGTEYGLITRNIPSGTQTVSGSGNFTVIGTGTDNTANSTAKLPVLVAKANTSAPTWTDGNMAPLSVDGSGNLRITGSVSTSNPSVSTTGTAPPASATYIGGSVTTLPPTYTTGQMSALSLTTAGALRIDGTATYQPVAGAVYTSYQPDPSSTDTLVNNGIALDTSGRLETHGSITTDEGSFRDDFVGTTLTTTLAGTVTFTNNSNIVTGSGTNFTKSVLVGQFIKKSSDAETLYVLVSSVNSDTSLTLSSVYTGTTAATTAVVSNWKTFTGSGGSLTISNSNLVIASGTTSGSSTYIQRKADYLPFSCSAWVNISQNIANQTAFFGFIDTASTPANPIKQVMVQISGTNNNQVSFITSSLNASYATEITNVILPAGASLLNNNLFQIDITGAKATLSINGTLVAVNNLHIPGPYDQLNYVVGITNTGTPASNTTLYCDSVYFCNSDRLEVANSFIGDPLNTLSSIKDTNNRTIRATISQEIKVAGLYTLSDLTNKYELDTRQWDTLTATGGTAVHVPALSALRVSVTGTSGSTAAICTNTYFKYQAGYTQLIALSIINSDSGQANQVREWGYFDGYNGLFFRLSGTALNIVERSNTSGSVVDTIIPQNLWNVDKLDGTGLSSITLDVTKGNLYEIEVQWYGVGTVRYFIDNILVHESLHANTLTVPYTATAQLPVQFRIANSGASSAGSLTMICARVGAQGQIHEPFEWSFSAFTASDLLVGTTEIPIMTIRPKSLYNSITNRMVILPKVLTVSTEGYKMSWKLIYNATLTGASYTSASALSGVEYDVSATSYSGGELILRGFLNNDIDSDYVDLSPLFDMLGRKLRMPGFAGLGSNTSQDTLTLVATCESVGKTRARANITWVEVR